MVSLVDAIRFTPGSLLPTGGEGKVHVRWLGTAGFEIRAEGHSLLFDPYVTRAPLNRCLTRRLVPDDALGARVVPRADAIVVGHTHFDHALDVPAIAKRTGAMVFGSRSAHALCRAAGVPESHLDVVESPTEVEREVGPFRLRFVPSAHSRFLLGRVPFPGEIKDCEDVPLRMQQYRCGAIFGVEVEVAGRRIFHVGSAELVDASLTARETDLVLLCVAGWTTSRELPERVMRKLGPRAILLSHWDNFFRSIDRPAVALPAMQVDRLIDRVAASSRDARVGTLPILGEVAL